jgi:hypothetical protein
VLGDVTVLPHGQFGVCIICMQYAPSYFALSELIRSALHAQSSVCNKAGASSLLTSPEDPYSPTRVRRLPAARSLCVRRRAPFVLETPWFSWLGSNGEFCRSISRGVCRDVSRKYRSSFHAVKN